MTSETITATVVDNEEIKVTIVGSDIRTGAQSSGAGAPSTAPPMLGAIYIDTTNNKAYVAMGTSSSSDWKKMMTQ